MNSLKTYVNFQKTHACYYSQLGMVQIFTLLLEFITVVQHRLALRAASRGMYQLVKPKNRDHVPCLMDSHFAYRGRTRNFSKSQSLYKGEELGSIA